MGKLFGTDGVRGIANHILTPEVAFDLGRAAATVLSEGCSQPTFIIGKDTRISGDMLEAALSAGICSAGGNVVSLGVIPTPGVAYLCRQRGATAGVVISASHNPMADNGIKFFTGEGRKLPDQVEDDIEAMIFDDSAVPRAVGADVGTINIDFGAIDAYKEYLQSLIDCDLSGLKIVVDGANGAAYYLGPAIFRHLGAEVVEISCQPNGCNINDHCGSTHTEHLQNAVLQEKADLGIAFDGDADRVLIVDECGQLVDGDKLICIAALALKERGQLDGNKVVVTVMSNMGFHLAMKAHGIEVVEANVGDRYVLEKMDATGAVLGGEQSGHIIFTQVNSTGDGLGTALNILSIMCHSQQKISQLAEVMQCLPQVLINVPVKDKTSWTENNQVMQAISEAKLLLGDSGRILVRPSGTESLLRVMGEGPHLSELEKIVTKVAACIQQQQN